MSEQCKLVFIDVSRPKARMKQVISRDKMDEPTVHPKSRVVVVTNTVGVNRIFHFSYNNNPK